MQVTVEIPEQRITDMVRQRLAELFGDDARFRDSTARDTIRRIVDEAATDAVLQARDAIAGQLPELAAEATKTAIVAELDKAAKRGLVALRKLYAGFDPAKLTGAQRDWLAKQLAEAAAKEETKERRLS
jgi:hypothetical protein